MISKPLPNHGDKRTRIFFAWWPIYIKINNHWHIVWLETVEVSEVYTRGFENGFWRYIEGKVCS